MHESVSYRAQQEAAMSNRQLLRDRYGEIIGQIDIEGSRQIHRSIWALARHVR
jgi:hypothetical protein